MAEQEQDRSLLLPVIDSHIHLWPLSEVSSLSREQPEEQQRSVSDYKGAVAKSTPSLLGYVFIEADRKNNHPEPNGEADEEKSWEAPLQEVRWMRRLVTQETKEDDGVIDIEEDHKLCLGLVPWAPMARGPEVLERYLTRAQKEAGEETWKKVKGFRYLLQDKPHGTMLTDEFIGSLKLLGRRGYTFDVGVDHHRRGKKQLEEAVEMVEKAHEGVPEDEQVTFILSTFPFPDNHPSLAILQDLSTNNGFCSQITSANPTCPLSTPHPTALSTLGARPCTPSPRPTAPT